MLKELIAPTFFIALSVWVWVHAGGMPAGEGGAPGPAFFPRLIAAAIGLLGFFLLITALRAPKTEAEKSAPGGAAKIIAFLAMLTAYAALLLPLGFILSTFMFLLAAAQWMRRRGVVANIVFSAAATAAVYAIFGLLLKVSLPILPFGM